jgi:hypothetical protein
MVGWHRDGYSADRQQARVLARLPEAPGIEWARPPWPRDSRGRTPRSQGSHKVSSFRGTPCEKTFLGLLPSTHHHQLWRIKTFPCPALIAVWSLYSTHPTASTTSNHPALDHRRERHHRHRLRRVRPCQWLQCALHRAPFFSLHRHRCPALCTAVPVTTLTCSRPRQRHPRRIR